MKERKPFKVMQTAVRIFGVAGGLAYALGWPAFLVRIVLGAAALALFTNKTYYIGDVIVTAYVLAWLCGPHWDKDPEDFEARTT